MTIASHRSDSRCVLHSLLTIGLGLVVVLGSSGTSVFAHGTPIQILSSGGISYQPSIGTQFQPNRSDPSVMGRPDDEAFGDDPSQFSPGDEYNTAPPMTRSPAAAYGVPPPFLSPLTTPQASRNMSLLAVVPTPPRRIQVHDIVSVLVSERSEVIHTSQFNRQRNITFVAQVREFFRLDDEFRLKPAAKDSPQANTALRSQLQSFGNNRSNELITYRIAATVVDVLPNGNLILEAKKAIETNGDLWEYTLTGIVRAQDVAPNNEAMSERIADLQIKKREYGRVRDSTKRGHFMRLYDFLLPF